MFPEKRKIYAPAWQVGLTRPSCQGECLPCADQLALVMSPVSQLRRTVRDIRDGRKNRVAGSYPVEMEPIVTKLNELPQQNEQSVETAHPRASNFAHSLKMPLTIIDTLVKELR